jgi:hypothetical protein
MGARLALPESMVSPRRRGRCETLLGFVRDHSAEPKRKPAYQARDKPGFWISSRVRRPRAFGVERPRMLYGARATSARFLGPCHGRPRNDAALGRAVSGLWSTACSSGPGYSS